jgi:hypothetical protein
LRQAFIQPDRAQASQMLRHVADQLRQKWSKLAGFIDDSEADVLSYMDFPEPHRGKIHSTDEIDKPQLQKDNGFSVRQAPFFCPGQVPEPHRAQRLSRVAAGHRAAAHSALGGCEHGATLDQARAPLSF